MALRIITAEERLSASPQSDEPGHASQGARMTISGRLGIGKTSLLRSIPLPEALFLNFDDAAERRKG